MSGGINILLPLYDCVILTETALPIYPFHFGRRRIKKYGVAPPTGSEHEPSDVHTACVSCDATLFALRRSFVRAGV